MRPKSLVLPTVAAAVVLVIALALGTSGAKTTSTSSKTVVATASHVKVKIYMYAFTPANLTVKAGTRITFTNMDMTAHTATALNGDFDTGSIQPGKSATIDVTKAGTYPYHCLFHEFMTGTLKVVG